MPLCVVCLGFCQGWDCNTSKNFFLIINKKGKSVALLRKKTVFLTLTGGDAKAVPASQTHTSTYSPGPPC
jgi:hypothetical protein